MEHRRQDGSALLVTVIMLVLISAIGLGLVLTTSLEPTMSAAYEASLAALYGAESAIAIAVHELGGHSDWNLLLTGQARSTLLDGNPDARIILPDGSGLDLRALTNSINCGHADACTSGEMDGFTADRPWGPNNPRWQLFGHARLDERLPAAGRIPHCYVVVWLADDPAEQDGNPLRDSLLVPPETRPPGAGMVTLRADGFGTRSSRRTVTITVARPRWAGDPRLPVVAWRERR